MLDRIPEFLEVSRSVAVVPKTGPLRRDPGRELEMYEDSLANS
jgi:hypothetical protein